MNFFFYLRSFVADILYRPRGLARMGASCRVALPRRIRGAASIEFGTAVKVDAKSWFEAVQSYHNQRFSPRIIVRDNVTIGRHATITAIGRIDIGEGCLFSEGVYISDHGHDVLTPGDTPLVERPLVHGGNVFIGAFCFLGFRACVLPGVVLGDHCVVGAHAVVTHSFPPGSVIAGCPAKLLRIIELPT